MQRAQERALHTQERALLLTGAGAPPVLKPDFDGFYDVIFGHINRTLDFRFGDLLFPLVFLGP